VVDPAAGCETMANVVIIILCIFGKERTKDHRFGSLGLNLTFEGILLGASFHLRAKPTSTTPTSWDP
jgi:hypothetical protein